MLENLLNLVQQNSGESIIQNPAIPNERNDEAVALASNSIFDGIKNAVSNGNMNDVLSMLNQNNTSNENPITQHIQGGFIQDLIQKIGIDSSAASSIASNLIPTVLQNLVSKTNDPNDSSFDLQSIIQNVGGGNFDIKNIINSFSGNNSTTQSGGSNILDNVKGLFGNL